MVLDELESLKPEVDRLNKGHTRSEKEQQNRQLPAVNNGVSFDTVYKQVIYVRSHEVFFFHH